MKRENGMFLGIAPIVAPQFMMASSLVLFNGLLGFFRDSHLADRSRGNRPGLRR